MCLCVLVVDFGPEVRAVERGVLRDENQLLHSGAGKGAGFGDDVAHRPRVEWTPDVGNHAV